MPALDGKVLDAEKFNQITRYGKLKMVLSGIDSALSSGLTPVKLNVVVARGMNDDEIGDFAKLTEKMPLHVRFIELMPFVTDACSEGRGEEGKEHLMSQLNIPIPFRGMAIYRFLFRR